MGLGYGALDMSLYCRLQKTTDRYVESFLHDAYGVNLRKSGWELKRENQNYVRKSIICTPEYAKNTPEGCTNYAKPLVFQYLLQCQNRGKTYQRVWQTTEKHWYAKTMRHARTCEKRTRGANKLRKNISIPILGGSSHRRRMEVQEYTKNTREGWLNHRKTLARQYHEAH